MCGIAAIFGKNAGKKHFACIFPMTDLIAHRGPDDEGFVLFSPNPTLFAGKTTPDAVLSSRLPYAPKHHFDGSFPEHPIAALGHRRLSILDLSAAGHQPLCSECSRFWITYNGEVYNYVEIRIELEKLGHHFFSGSDTEVILKAYQEWGADALNRFNGMFAFIIYDQLEQKFFAARDRFGVKPLYYWVSPEGFIAFASEIKQFTCFPSWRAEMDQQNAYDFLNWGVQDHNQGTLFKGVAQLRGGTYMEGRIENLQARQWHIRQWYTLQPAPFTGSFQDAAAEFKALLSDAVRLRLRADVTVGSCLSGGLDSSSIVCLMQQQLASQASSYKQQTFSACSHQKSVDERFFIDTVVKATGVEPHYTYPDLNTLFEECEAITWHQDEPFPSTSIYAQWLVFKMVKEKKVKVMLDGQGADEQLGGYHGFFGHYFYDLFCSLKWKALWRDMRLTKQMHGALQPERMLLNRLIPNYPRQIMRKMLKKGSVRPAWLDTTRLQIEERFPFAHMDQDSFFQQSRMQILYSNLPMLLHYEDRDSMAHSVESRTPFLDYRLVEFNLGLPSSYKLSEGWTKRVLREGMKELLPERISQRIDKIGFATAEEHWVIQQNPDLFRKKLKEAIDLSNGVLNSNASKELEEMIAGKRAFSFQVWRWINFGLWMKKYKIMVSK